jgi:diguanylate cyclase (GGDEF)-like protein/PAS domain S-box-containing protein
LSKSVGISVVVISVEDDHVAAINTALRDAGHPAHCNKVSKVGNLESALLTQAPDLVLLFAKEAGERLQEVCNKVHDTALPAPVLLVSETVDEEIIASAIQAGARDVVSLGNIERLQAVATRELRARKIEKTLQNVVNSANQFKQELNTLKQASVEAIADIQEGIVLHANPAWLELFGLEDGADMTGMPVMDLCCEADRSALKGAIVACQKGKWKDSELAINGRREDGSEFPVVFSLANIEYDGDPAVRVIITPKTVENKTPLSLVEQAVQRDQATGFFNQQHFLYVARERLKQAPQGGVRALAYMRPDSFARARSDIGLMGTEAVLAQLAQILREFIQPADIYCRFGGTMFTVMVERGTMADVESWAEQLLEAVSEAVFEHDERSTALTCSIGLCEVDSAEADILALLDEAEGACRAARATSGNRIQLSESSGAAKKIRQDDTIWVPRIRGALMENRLRLEHQPIAGLNDDIENAYDTLVRMLDEDGNTVLPSEFMQVAERKGLTKNIDRWVIGASFTFCATNDAKLVFIRLSKDSVLDETLIGWLESQARDAQLEPAQICFEISEDIAVQHLRQTQLMAESLRTAGFRFAIEHFGKSRNPDRTITKIPMDFVKIDGSLMQGLHKNTNAQSKVKELARLANNNSVRTIAERVQDANTMAVLWQLGVSYIQGNYVQNNEIVIEDTSQTSITTQMMTLGDEEKEASTETVS